MIDEIFIHCSATHPAMDIGADEIRQWHKAKGWADIGYHYVIRRNGVIEPGRDLDGDGEVEDEQGAHVYGHNRNTLGICMIGGIAEGGQPDTNFTLAQWSSLAGLLRVLQARHPGVIFRGHRDADPGKACPTFDVEALFYKGTI